MRTRSFLLTATLLAVTATAQALDLPDAGRMLRESAPPPMLTAPPKAPEIKAPTEPGKPSLPDNVRVQVTGFSYSGNTVFTAQELDAIMAPVIGREISLAELERSVERITQAYRVKGYVLASTVIPPQTLTPGQPIKVEIIEGILEDIEIKTKPAETRTPRKLLERYSKRIPTGKPLNSDQLTETALLLNELPGIQSRFLLEPGKKPGSARAILEATEDKPYSASLFSDNHGNYSTGYYRIGAGLDLYSPFRLGDRLNLTGQSSTSGDTQSAGIGWSVPVSPFDTRISLNYSWVRYQLGRSFKSLDANGDAHDLGLTITQPLVRRNDLFLNATAGVKGRLLDDRINSVDTINNRHTVSGQTGITLYRADNLLNSGSTSFNLLYSIGTLEFDNAAIRANDQGASGLHSEGIYHKISGLLSRTQTIFNDLTLYAGFSGQWGSKNLDSAEQLSIGGPTAVRAYPVGEGSADLGMISTAELRYLLPKLEPLPGRVQLAGLFDHGYAEIDAKPLAGARRNSRHLYGAGFGVSWQWDELVSLKSSVAWRLGELPTSDNTGGTKPTVYLQAVVRY